LFLYLLLLLLVVVVYLQVWLPHSQEGLAIVYFGEIAT
jgi:hypothetical protein